jgi:hypothetical protein
MAGVARLIALALLAVVFGGMRSDVYFATCYGMTPATLARIANIVDIALNRAALAEHVNA